MVVKGFSLKPRLSQSLLPRKSISAAVRLRLLEAKSPDFFPWWPSDRMDEERSAGDGREPGLTLQSKPSWLLEYFLLDKNRLNI